jgi:NDP-sugar pyrophosphorylase family protein
MRAVILAGGKGTRLKPYTTVFPKPLVPIDNMPIVEIVIRQLKAHGFNRVTLSVGHLAELLIAYFGDGSKWGVQIEYSKEDQPLGTTGALALIPGLNQTFLAMNGDILTTLDYGELVDYHRQMGAVATIAMHKRSVKIDLGVLETNEQNELVGYIEKPVYDYRVSMGIYVFEPKILQYIKPGERLDLPDLIHLLLQNGEKVMGYPYDGYWLDIGRHDDYEQAIEEFSRMRGQFLQGDDANG